ncbi:unnamed protein product [Macrosiphum euphorbiae]|uniref:Uncharacterized protein n=1 Tax=Macrosiphum euphorbiae TaxID=13131 RepID=A0AAV0WBN0_9HEMI|nr:unnamed protein product [Macrosiphum euphorbiae]
MDCRYAQCLQRSNIFHAAYIALDAHEFLLRAVTRQIGWVTCHEVCSTTIGRSATISGRGSFYRSRFRWAPVIWCKWWVEGRLWHGQ